MFLRCLLFCSHFRHTFLYTYTHPCQMRSFIYQFSWNLAWISVGLFLLFIICFSSLLIQTIQSLLCDFVSVFFFCPKKKTKINNILKINSIDNIRGDWCFGDSVVFCFFFVCLFISFDSWMSKRLSNCLVKQIPIERERERDLIDCVWNVWLGASRSNSFFCCL